ncbi:MAG: MerR family transcriptional regulator [Ktedonobacteraceae bacterium]|nr:MerR family transcriptional regulator [Ktedonobacteraceae bacterium]
MYLTIQEVASRTGLSAHTIRYYEKSGVLPRVQRTESGIRQFTETDLASLRFISDYKQAGMPLEEIKEIIGGITQYGCILKQFEHGEITEHSFLKRLALLCEHRQRLMAQRDHLDQMLAAVNQKIGLYEQQFAEKPGKERARKGERQ